MTLFSIFKFLKYEVQSLIFVELSLVKFYFELLARISIRVTPST